MQIDGIEGPQVVMVRKDLKETGSMLKFIHVNENKGTDIILKIDYVKEINDITERELGISGVVDHED